MKKRQKDKVDQVISLAADAFLYLSPRDEHEFSEAFNNKMSEFFAQIKQENQPEQKNMKGEQSREFPPTADLSNSHAIRPRRSYRAILRTALAVIFIVALLAAISVAAFGTKICFWNRNAHGEYSEISENEDSSNSQEEASSVIPESWSNFWFPEYTPKGFSLSSAEENFQGKALTYKTNDDENDYFVFRQQEGNTIASTDNEGTEVDEIYINGVEAYAFEKEYGSNVIHTILWTSDDMAFFMEGDISFDELEKVAESLVLINNE